jgi:hypothetical protein
MHSCTTLLQSTSVPAELDEQTPNAVALLSWYVSSFIFAWIEVRVVPRRAQMLVLSLRNHDEPGGNHEYS